MKNNWLFCFILLLFLNGSSIAEPISDVFQNDTIGQSNGSDFSPNMDIFHNYRSLHGFEDLIQYPQWILKNKKEGRGLIEERLDRSHISNGGVSEASGQTVQILSDFESSDISSPKVTEFFPDNGYNSAVSQSVTIVGSGFVPGISANITNGTYRQRNTTSIIFTSSEEITATFNLRKLIPGKYWIEVQNPDGFTNNKKYNRTWGSFGSAPGEFWHPGGVAVDSSGNIYVADTMNHRIQKFSSDGLPLAYWGSRGYKPGEFDGPEDIAVDSSGNVFVADTYNSRIQKFSSDGLLLGYWGSSGSAPGDFGFIFDIAVDTSGTLYVTDTENDRIQKFNGDGVLLGYWGSSGSTPGKFDSPLGVAVDSLFNVYVADTGNDRVQKFTRDGLLLGYWGCSGSAPGEFGRPSAITVDSSGNIYVTEIYNSRVQKFSSDGALLGYFGSPGSAPGEFAEPFGIDVDLSGNLYVADSNNHRIQKFSEIPFTVYSPPPVVTGIDPSSGQIGSLIPFNLTGEFFESGSMINLTMPGQTNMSTLGIMSGPNLTGSFFFPAGISTGSWNVSVNRDGLFSNYNVQFTITAAPVQKPVIHNLNPGGVLYQSQSSSFPVIITGTGFDTVASVNGVTLDGSPIVYTVRSPTQIDAVFPETVDEVLENHLVIVTGVAGSSAPYNFVVSGNGFTITTISDDIGWINPAGPIYNVPAGSSKTFNFKSSAGAIIKNVTVNGNEVPLTSDMTYTLENIDRNYEVRLNCEPLPGVIIPAFTATSLGGNTVRFTDASLGSPTTWKWDFGDKEHGEGNPVDHVYKTPGAYTVTLHVRNDFTQSQVVMGNIEVPMSNTQGSVYIY